jgi:alpha-beta hydrolase superfamily lysophospholipase
VTAGFIAIASTGRQQLINDAMSIEVGEGGDARRIAVLRRPGSAPGLLWLGGYRSDMRGTKAEAVDAFAAKRGLAFTRLDYSGHGESGGRFEDGTISRWLEEATAVFGLTDGPQIVIGSSMGGWLALLLAEAERTAGGRIAGLVLTAPAVDMTKALMWDRMPKAARKELRETGVYHEPSHYGGDPAPITERLIDDGERHLFGGRLIETGCPVHILQGMEDPEVPWRTATTLIEHLASDDALLTLVKDGDHRLSRPEDLARLEEAIADMIAAVSP